MAVQIKFKIDEEVNFYFYLINLYSCEDKEVNHDFRKKYSHLRSEEFFNIFENIENPFLKDFMNINKVDDHFQKLIELEKQNFLSIWPDLKKSATKLEKNLKQHIQTIEENFNKIINLVRVKPIYQDFFINIVPSLKPHGKQDNKNFIYIGIKDDLEGWEDYMFIILHELTHVLLYKFMSKYYFKYGYLDELHIVEETLINYIYFQIIPESGKKEILPRWLYLMNGDHYNSFCNLLEIRPLIKKDLHSFMESALKKIGLK